MNTDSTVDIACAGYTDGKIYVSHNGTGPFTYDWTPGNINTEDLVDVGPGIYELELTDANGCTNIPFEDTLIDLVNLQDLVQKRCQKFLYKEKIKDFMMNLC